MSGHVCGCDPEAAHHCAEYPKCGYGQYMEAAARYRERHHGALGEPTTHCRHCGYAEYVNGDAERAQVRLETHEAQCPNRPAPPNVDGVMADAWDLTTRDRHNQYGSAEDAFRAYGHIWTGLLAHKLKDDAVINASDVCLMMTGLKLGREVRNSKRDNVVDAHGYLSLLSRLRGWVTR